MSWSRNASHAICEGNPLVTGGLPSQRANNAGIWRLPLRQLAFDQSHRGFRASWLYMTSLYMICDVISGSNICNIWVSCNIDGLLQDYGNSNALPMELPHACTKPLISWMFYTALKSNCDWSPLRGIHWNGNVILTNFSSLAAPEVATLTTSGATSD